MKNYKIAIAVTVLAAVGISGSPARAQQVSAPIIVRSVDPAAPNAKIKGEWLKGEVIHADATSIVVHEPGNERMIHTFTVSPDLKDKMQAIVDRGGYQYGDKVKILHQHGQTVALKIHGKPSNPS
jgi:hypothetical protein